MTSNALTDSQNVAAAAFSLSANILSFITAAAGMVSRGNPVLALCHDFVKWIARERLSETEFDYCITLMQGLVIPNDRGLEIRQKLILGDPDPKSLCGLRLTSAGSIGRMLAWNPEFVYVVTTVAALMAYHEPDDAVEVLCCIATQLCQDHQEDIQDRRQISTYTPQKTRIRPVVIKIVESIAFNIVNLGNDFSDLSESFKDHCVHALPPITLANLVTAIIRKMEQDLVIYSSRLYGDLLMWLFVHYPGTIQVSIEGEIICEKSFGDSTARMMFFVRDGCTVNARSHTISGRLEMSVTMGSSLKTIFQNHGPITQIVPQPTLRQKLYSIDQISHSFARDVLKNQHIHDIEATAQVIAEWLLDIPLFPISQDELLFGVMLDGSKEILGDSMSGLQIKTFAVGQILRRWPSIGHLRLGSMKKARSVFQPFDTSTCESLDDLDLPIGVIIQSFPLLQDLLGDLKMDCHCLGCRKNVSGEFMSGCLQERGWTTFCLLLAHVIADGFGVPDASGLTDPLSLAHLVKTLLSELLAQRTVSWDKWFAVAAAVFLGCPTDFATGDRREKIARFADEGSSTLVAAQFGSLIVASGWSDLTRELNLNGCFGLETAEGNLHGVPQDFAIVQTEVLMKAIVDIESLNIPASKIASEGKETRIPHSIRQIFDLSNHDDCELTYQIAIIGGAGIPYRMLTMVRIDKYIRVVDPAKAVIALAWCLVPTCRHRSDDQKQLSIDASFIEFRSYGMDSVLASWPSYSPSTNTPSPSEDSALCAQMRSTRTCDSPLKLNVALATCGGRGVIRRKNCCIACAISCWHAYPGHLLHIINVELGLSVVATSSQ